jgi:hypothetical protein
MAVGIGLWFAFAGLVAALAGLTARGRVRRLRRSGRSAWAMVVPHSGMSMRRAAT